MSRAWEHILISNSPMNQKVECWKVTQTMSHGCGEIRFQTGVSLTPRLEFLPYHQAASCTKQTLSFPASRTPLRIKKSETTGITTKTWDRSNFSGSNFEISNAQGREFSAVLFSPCQVYLPAHYFYLTPNEKKFLT